MSTVKRVLRSESGVVLTEVGLRHGAAIAAVAYTITSRRTPEAPSFDLEREANAAFDAEVALCQNEGQSI